MKHRLKYSMAESITCNKNQTKTFFSHHSYIITVCIVNAITCHYLHYLNLMRLPAIICIIKIKAITCYRLHHKN